MTRQASYPGQPVNVGKTMSKANQQPGVWAG